MFHSRKRVTNTNVDERDIVQGAQGTTGDARTFGGTGDISFSELSPELIESVLNINSGVYKNYLDNNDKQLERMRLLSRDAIQTNTALSRTAINFSDMQSNRNRDFAARMANSATGFAKEMVRRGQFASDRALASVDKLNQRTLALSQQSVSAVKKAYEDANTSSSDKLTQMALIGAVGIGALAILKK